MSNHPWHNPDDFSNQPRLHNIGGGGGLSAGVLEVCVESVDSMWIWGAMFLRLLDTLQVCRDFKYGQCVRPACKFVHLLEDHVEVTDMKVSVCRDAVKGKCGRGLCKYYHLPVVLPPAPLDPHSARAPQSGPRHHGLHNPPNNPLMLDNAHYMDNTTTTTKPAPTPSNNNSSSNNNNNNNNSDPATNPANASSIQVIANLSSSNNIICN
ncbi:zinc finger CCCH domain-containing protein 45-like [Penaeus japonicus]|uniref:zinc finger CCCH domain-containing protein 45-like n=1 Tax=Penaeus japonicus TaxID=27405 RepID=UPI001C71573E|nr:zinc finger CCCH domain-containing protein 45-like [Penaeus japonicus]